jgi:hypothetical protein
VILSAIQHCQNYSDSIANINLPGLGNRDYGRRGSAALTTQHHLYPQTLALTSPTSGGSSVGVVRSRTQATEEVYINLHSLGWSWKKHVVSLLLPEGRHPELRTGRRNRVEAANRTSWFKENFVLKNSKQIKYSPWSWDIQLTTNSSTNRKLYNDECSAYKTD